MFFLFTAITSAVMNDYLVVEFNWEYDDVSDTSGNNYDLTDNGCNRQATGGIGNSGYLHCEDDVHMAMTDDFQGYGCTNQCTLVFWNKFSERNGAFVFGGDYNGGNGVNFYAETGAGMFSGYTFPGDHRIDPGTIDTDLFGSWSMLTVRWNTTHMQFWLNDTYKDTVSLAGGSIGDSGVVFLIHDRGDGGANNDEVTIYDNFCLWNTTLNSANISYLWNNGAAVNCSYEVSGSPPVSPTLSLNTNLVNNTQNYSQNTLLITFNGTFTNENTDLANCSIYVDLVEVNFSEYNLSVNNMHTVDVSNSERWYNFSVNCSNYEVSDSTILFEYNIDNVLPIITTNFVNNSVYNESDTFVLEVNFTDPNLYAYNITILRNNIVWFNNFTENLLGTTYTNITSHTLAIGDSYQTWQLIISAGDSHTNTKVRPLKIKQLENRVYVDDLIQFEGIKDMSFYLDDTENSYEFTIYFENESDIQTFYIMKTTGVYLPESKYIGHFVFWDIKKALDLESDNIKDLVITELEDRYEVTAYLPNEDTEIEFKSIVDLNYVEYKYSFSVNDRSIIYMSSISQSLEDILGVIRMLPVYIFYIALLYLSYHMLMNANLFAGIILWIFTIGMDFLITADLWNTYHALIGPSTYGRLIWLFILFLYVWVVMKVAILAVLRPRAFKAKRYK